MLINIDKLKRDLIDYYGTAAFNGMSAAMIDVYDLKNASLEKLEELASRAGFDLRDYEEEDMER